MFECADPSVSKSGKPDQKYKRVNRYLRIKVHYDGRVNWANFRHAAGRSVTVVPGEMESQMERAILTGIAQLLPLNRMMCRRSRFDGRPAGKISNCRIAFRSAATFSRNARLSSVSR